MAFFDPASIAVIGASATEGKVGHDILKNLVSQGYEGQIYPVNPKYEDVLGKKAYPSIDAIPGDVDMAIIVTPAATVVALAEACGKKGVKTLVVITAGFKETGSEGAAREEELAAIIRRYDMTLVGANCLGLLRPHLKLNASFAKEIPPAGPVALLSQSGALAVALMDVAPQIHLGFSVVVSMGNKTTHDECDFLEACAADERTHVIGLYLESITNGQRFREVATRIAATKPIVLLKAGTSEHGQKAISSHTGALAGSDAAITAACRQAGIHRAKDAEEFIDLLQVLSTQPALPSRSIAIVTNAGGLGVLATDAAEKHGLRLAALSAKTTETLAAALPPSASTKNPIDVLGDAGADRYQVALEQCLADSSVDGLAVLLTPQVMTPAVDVAKTIVAAHKKFPLYPIVAGFMGGEGVEEATDLLQQHGIPVAPSPERAIRMLASLRARKQQAATSNRTSAHAEEAARIIGSHTGLLPDDTIDTLCRLYSLPTPHSAIAQTAEEAVAVAERIGYPVIAKVSAKDILHKTDIGGVRMNIKNADEVIRAFNDITADVRKHEPNADVRGILIQQFLPVGSEFIVGAVRDPSFGPLMMVGLGGIYTELFRDTSFRLCPLDERTAYEMLQDLHSWKLLLGMRGKQQSDIDGLARTLATVAQLMIDCPQITELDLNPVLVREDGIVVADAKIVVGALSGQVR